MATLMWHPQGLPFQEHETALQDLCVHKYSYVLGRIFLPGVTSSQYLLKKVMAVRQMLDNVHVICNNACVD